MQRKLLKLIFQKYISIPDEYSKMINDRQCALNMEIIEDYNLLGLTFIDLNVSMLSEKRLTSAKKKLI